MSLWLTVTIDVLVHLGCAAAMFFISRARGPGNPWGWGFIGLLTGVLGLIVFLAVLGWQVMFQRGAEQRTRAQSRRMITSQQLAMDAYREGMEIPERDGYLDRLIFEERLDDARGVAKEQLRQAWEQGDTDREKLMRRYLDNLETKSTSLNG